MSLQISWFPIAHSENLEDVYQKYVQWENADDPRENYLRKKWFKTVNQLRSMDEIEELLLAYKPEIRMEQEEDEQEPSYYLQLTADESAMIWFGIRSGESSSLISDITVRLGFDQQTDQYCMDQAMHFMAYLGVRGHGLVCSEEAGWLDPKTLRKHGEKIAPLPVFSSVLKLVKSQAKDAYSKWKATKSPH